MRPERAGGIEFLREGATLQVRQAWSATALFLWPVAMLPFILVFLFYGPAHMAFAHNDPFLIIVMALGLLGEAAYVAWALRGRLVPFIADGQANTLCRGKSRICALSDVLGAGIVVQHGRSNIYYVSLALKTQSKPHKMFPMLTANGARMAAQELAKHLNVPSITDQEEGMWWK